MFIDNNLITPLCFPTKPLGVLCVSVTESVSKFLLQLNISCIWDFIFIHSARQKWVFLSSCLFSVIVRNHLVWFVSMWDANCPHLELSGCCTATPYLVLYSIFLSINEIKSRQQGSSYRYEQLPACLLGKMFLFLCKGLAQYIYRGSPSERE